jgi:hypothetical protein
MTVIHARIRNRMGALDQALRVESFSRRVLIAAVVVLPLIPALIILTLSFTLSERPEGSPGDLEVIECSPPLDQLTNGPTEDRGENLPVHHTVTRRDVQPDCEDAAHSREALAAAIVALGVLAAGGVLLVSRTRSPARVSARPST